MTTAEPKFKVVIAEDHHAMRALTRDVLESSNRFEIVGEAENGNQAIDLCKQAKPDLVLLDLKMPVRDGFDALPEIRRVAPGTKVVAYSMLQRDANEKRVLEMGATMFLEKNIESHELVARLIGLLDGHPNGASAGGKPPRGPWNSLGHRKRWAQWRIWLGRSSRSRPG